MAYYESNLRITDAQKERCETEGCKGAGLPECEECGRKNEQFSYENPLATVSNPSGLMFYSNHLKSERYNDQYEFGSPDKKIKYGKFVEVELDFQINDEIITIIAFKQSNHKSRKHYGSEYDDYSQTLRRADCHGITFTNGDFWINNDQVPKILDSGLFQKINTYKSSFFSSRMKWLEDDRILKGDVVIYRDKDNIPVHSVTVGADDESEHFDHEDKLNIPVIGKGGNQSDIYGKDESEHYYSDNENNVCIPIKEMGETIGTAWQDYEQIEIYRYKD